MIGDRRRITPLPGIDPYSGFMSNPTTTERIRFINSAAGIFDFGLQFPYNNDSQTDHTTSGAATWSDYLNRYRDLTINHTITAGVSPLYIFARSLTIGASGILDANGAGAAGGAGGASSVVGNDGTRGDLGAATLTSPPQFYKGLATGGSGGGGSTAAGGAGGRTGGALGSPSFSLAGPAGGAVNTVGNAGANKVRNPVLGDLAELLKTHIGGAGGGGGGGGVAAGANGGAGGGIIVICCEQFTSAGIIRAAGNAGSAATAAGGGNGGGGGGGSGGLIIVLTMLYTAQGTLTVTGGAGGAGNGTGGAGGAGGAGYALFSNARAG